MSGPDQSGQQLSRNNRRVPRKVSETSLRNAALYYMQRFSSSAENLRAVLMRRVHRSAHYHGTDPEQGAAWIAGIIQRFQEAGLLDDRAYAETKVRSLRERGNSDKSIRYKLLSKGVSRHLVEGALVEVFEKDGSVEETAALAFARKRRLGPFAPGEARSALRNRHLAAMARAGFSYDLALRIIDADADDPLVACSYHRHI